MSRISLILFSLAATILPFASQGADVVLREPFTLRLHVDATHYYEESFGKIPYVHEGTIYLFKDDAFGVNLGAGSTNAASPVFVPEGKGGDLELKFSQQAMDGAPGAMLLVIANRTKQTILVDALMTVPGRKEILRTTILPIRPGLTNYESWPHPIIQLALRNIRTQP